MRVLFGVFDWGFGHATRDIPLIAALLRDHEVHILATGDALRILRNHFAERCCYHDIPSIYAPYTKTRLFQLKFSVSLPKMARSLKRARRRSKRIIDRGFDKVISDCRYDVYDRPENSYFINHQLRFKAPPGAERFFERWLAWRMKKYRYIIVPDYEDRNLSGALSHDLRYLPPEKIKYIGILSHLRRRELPQDIDYFISLSGPEPQRSTLEERILSQVGQLSGKVIIAGGKSSPSGDNGHADVEYCAFQEASRQEEVMNRAKFIITRSGYTTMMELAELGKTNVLLLPTPGQTEQEYLADYCEQQQYFHHVSQYKLTLPKDTERARGFAGFAPPWKTAESVARFMDIVCS